MIPFFKSVFVLTAVLSSLLSASLTISNQVSQLDETLRENSATSAQHARQMIQPCVDEEPIIMRSRVKTTGGAALAGVTVSLTKPGMSTPAYSGFSDENGECVFDSVAVGQYRFTLAKTGYQTKNVDLNLTINTNRTDTLLVSE